MSSIQNTFSLVSLLLSMETYGTFYTMTWQPSNTDKPVTIITFRDLHYEIRDPDPNNFRKACENPRWNSFLVEVLTTKEYRASHLYDVFKQAVKDALDEDELWNVPTLMKIVEALSGEFTTCSQCECLTAIDERIVSCAADPMVKTTRLPFYH